MAQQRAVAYNALAHETGEGPAQGRWLKGGQCGPGAAAAGAVGE